MPKVEMTIKNGVQKGPATDYSMLLEMKRRSAVLNGQIWKNPPGDQKQKPFIREGHLQAGTAPFSGTGAVEYYKLKGLNLNLYKF